MSAVLTEEHDITRDYLIP